MRGVSSSAGLQLVQRMKPQSFLRICTWPRPVPSVRQFLLLLPVLLPLGPGTGELTPRGLMTPRGL